MDVAGYLAGLPATLPAPGVSVPALVQFTRPLAPSDAAAAGSGTTTTTTTATPTPMPTLLLDGFHRVGRSLAGRMS